VEFWNNGAGLHVRPTIAPPDAIKDKFAMTAQLAGLCELLGRLIGGCRIGIVAQWLHLRDSLRPCWCDEQVKLLLPHGHATL
jgi:hypothetical protein